VYKIILAEQKKFESTLEKGLKQLELRIKNFELGISGKDAFDL
jgi:alanyl-tRNA synthetase